MQARESKTQEESPSRAAIKEIEIGARDSHPSVAILAQVSTGTVCCRRATGMPHAVWVGNIPFATPQRGLIDVLRHAAANEFVAPMHVMMKHRGRAGEAAARVKGTRSRATKCKCDGRTYVFVRAGNVLGW